MNMTTHGGTTDASDKQPGVVTIGSKDGLGDVQPLMMTVRMDILTATIAAMETGLEYAQECLIYHDNTLGRTTIKNKRLAEMMEADVREINRLLELYDAWKIKSPND